MILRVAVNGKFGRWLYKNLRETDCSINELAEALRMAPKTIYRHLNGKMKPSFTSVVAYCWYFENDDYPEDIWDMVKEDEM